MNTTTTDSATINDRPPDPQVAQNAALEAAAIIASSAIYFSFGFSGWIFLILGACYFLGGLSLHLRWRKWVKSLPVEPKTAGPEETSR